MKRFVAVALAGAALLLAGCDRGIDHGVVTGRHHDHEDEYWYPATTCSGSPSVCSTYMQYSPPSDEYYLHLKNKKAEGERRVELDEYDRYKDGDYYGFPDK